MKPTEDNAPSRLGELILTWLLSQATGGTPNQIEKSLRPILELWRSPVAARRRGIDDEVALLEGAGRIKPVRRSSFELTANGRRAALAALRLASLSAEANWKTVKDRYLITCFIELLSTATNGPSASSSAKKQVPLPEDDKAFAQRVLAAARASKTGRFGDDKVFISHVVQRLDAEGIAIGDVEAFKERLVAVHRSKLLSLSRADLVQAMDPSDVDASETQYLSARFHFVHI